LQGKDFLHFVYDIFLGIRFHPKSTPAESRHRES
jgi:hypothetical protein